MKKTASQESERTAFTWALARRFYNVVIIYFTGEARWRARGLFAFMLMLCATTTGLFVVLSYTQRDFSTALSEKKQDAFYLAVWKFIGIVVAATPLFAVYDYVQGLMALEWRRWLTGRLLGKYFENRAYFDIKMASVLDNPDQRIAEDINDFTVSTVSIAVAVTGKVLNMGAFAQVLWSISPNLVYFLLAYSVVCVYVSIRIFGKKLMTLHFETLQREADFRYSLVRVRENAESIAFYRGERRESEAARGLFSHLVANIRERLLWGFHLSLFQNLYEYATIVIPSLIIAPRYFRGEVEFGVVMQTGFAFRTILYALTFIIQRFDDLSGLAAQTDRLESLMAALGEDLGQAAGPHSQKKSGKSRPVKVNGEPESEGTPLLSFPAKSSPRSRLPHSPGIGLPPEPQTLDPTPSPQPGSLEAVGKLSEALSSSGSGAVEDPRVGMIRRGDAPGLTLENLSIALPSPSPSSRPAPLLFPQGLSLRMPAGESLLVMGPSGCGKSSLLRAVAGLWRKGSGLIACPPQGSTFFLPQKPYMPLGTLRAQLLFPAEAVPHCTDQDLMEALDAVALGHLAEGEGAESREGSTDGTVLGVERDWSDCLSVGEQQRLAFARLLIQRPLMSFLDEASSALDAANEARLYRLLRERVGPSFVSVGHRASLLPFHDWLLSFHEDGGWRLVRAQEAAVAQS